MATLASALRHNLSPASLATCLLEDDPETRVLEGRLMALEPARLRMTVIYLAERIIASGGGERVAWVGEALRTHAPSRLDAWWPQLLRYQSPSQLEYWDREISPLTIDESQAERYLDLVLERDLVPLVQLVVRRGHYRPMEVWTQALRRGASQTARQWRPSTWTAEQLEEWGRLALSSSDLSCVALCQELGWTPAPTRVDWDQAWRRGRVAYLRWWTETTGETPADPELTWGRLLQAAEEQDLELTEYLYGLHPQLEERPSYHLPLIACRLAILWLRPALERGELEYRGSEVISATRLPGLVRVAEGRYRLSPRPGC